MSSPVRESARPSGACHSCTWDRDQRCSWRAGPSGCLRTPASIPSHDSQRMRPGPMHAGTRQRNQPRGTRLGNSFERRRHFCESARPTQTRISNCAHEPPMPHNREAVEAAEIAHGPNHKNLRVSSNSIPDPVEASHSPHTAKIRVMPTREFEMERSPRCEIANRNSARSRRKATHASRSTANTQPTCLFENCSFAKRMANFACDRFWIDWLQLVRRESQL